MFLQEVATAPTWMDPKFLLALGVALIGFVAWLIRLEAKEQGVEKTTTRLEQAINETYEAFEAHRSNSAIHFDQRLANEIEARRADRMDRMQNDISEIKAMLKNGYSK